MATKQIANHQRVLISIKPKKSNGKPAKVDGPATFASEDETLVRIEENTDDEEGLSAWAVAVGPVTDPTGPGCRVTASVDADLDPDEERTITATGFIQVVEGEAQVVDLEFAEPEDAPEVETPF